MDDRKSPFGISPTAFSAFSGRRKAAIIIAIMLLGTSLADPVFVNDAPGMAGVPDSGNLNEIELMLSEFSKEGTPELSQSGPAESSPAASESTTLIIPPPENSVNTPVQNVSFPTNQGTGLANLGASVMPTSPTDETPPPGHLSADRRGRHNSQTSPLAIRLTGTIYPAQ